MPRRLARQRLKDALAAHAAAMEHLHRLLALASASPEPIARDRLRRAQEEYEETSKAVTEARLALQRLTTSPEGQS